MNILSWIIGLFQYRRPKDPTKYADAQPRGISHSIIPEQYLKNVHEFWDKDYPLYTNQIILKNDKDETA